MEGWLWARLRPWRTAPAGSRVRVAAGRPVVAVGERRPGPRAAALTSAAGGVLSPATRAAPSALGSMLGGRGLPGLLAAAGWGTGWWSAGPGAACRGAGAGALPALSVARSGLGTGGCGDRLLPRSALQRPAWALPGARLAG